MAKITSIEALRTGYPPMIERSKTKELTALDQHCRAYLALSPFMMMGTQNKEGLGDVSPRGDLPGFVKVIDENTIAIPGRPGNNRLDSLSNILENPNVGLIFLVPGVNETLRINGRAEIRDDQDLKKMFEVNGNLPRCVILVHMDTAYMHCAKALMRSKLWDPSVQIERNQLPSMSEWMVAHNTLEIKPESTEVMEERYKKQLY
jgi:PPOX class probable FMN-dependent enzyme